QPLFEGGVRGVPGGDVGGDPLAALLLGGLVAGGSVSLWAVRRGRCPLPPALVGVWLSIRGFLPIFGGAVSRRALPSGFSPAGIVLPRAVPLGAFFAPAVRLGIAGLPAPALRPRLGLIPR